MKREDLAVIEATLEIDLPENYREYMLRFPASVSIINEVFGDNRFCNDPIKLIELNQLLSVKSKTILNEKFCIGHNDAGDYYFISIQDKTDEQVYFLDHEEMVAGAYDAESDTWNWELFETMPDLNTHRNEVLEIYGDPQQLISSSEDNSEAFTNEMIHLRKELYNR